MNESNKMIILIIVLYVSLIETLYFRINSIGIYITLRRRTILHRDLL